MLAAVATIVTPETLLGRSIAHRLTEEENWCVYARKKWDRIDYRDATITKAIEQTTETWTSHSADARSWVPVDADRVKPTLELLNASPVFGGRIHFTAMKRRGPMIVAGFSDGSEAIWRTMIDLASFARSQAILAEATNVLIPTPPRRSIKAVWEPAVQWILRLAGTDRISSRTHCKRSFRTSFPPHGNAPDVQMWKTVPRSLKCWKNA